MYNNTNQPLDFINEIQLQTFIDTLPCAVVRCLAGETRKFQQMSRDFLRLLGYTRDEIETEFGGSYLQLPVPEDRESVISQIQKQLKKGKEGTLCYRLLAKGGHPVCVKDNWRLVKNSDGAHSFWHNLTDITEEKQELETLRTSLASHQIILNQTTDILFEYNFATNDLSLSPNWEKKFGYSPLCKNVTVSSLTDTLHPKDAERFLCLLDKARSGNASPYTEEELRVRDKKGRYIWCRFRVSTQNAADGTPAKAVGVIADITSERISQQHLIERAERDALTGVYNKTTLQTLIEAFLQGTSSQILHAFLMIDFDNFKAINDTFGHLYGDSVLRELTPKIQSLFRSDDIVGRIGGDEFAVFIKNIPSEAFARRKATEIVHLFSSYTASSHFKSPVTCSVGAALFPIAGTTFPALYQKADIALYRAKELGKNRIALFGED